jgi:hypothetical protein
MDETMEHRVERRPARGIGGAGRLTGEVEELPGDARPAAGPAARGAPGASRQVTSEGATPSVSSTRAAACQASNVGAISTVLIT